jgi:ABC-type branched-subunit amino acid transport system ATPase component/predicted MFS family arabinose efflux permease
VADRTRPLVPTARQAASAAATSSKVAHGPAGEPPPPPPSRPSRGRLRLGRGRTRPARPKFEGPLLPLVVFSLISMAVRAEDAALGVMLPQIRAEFGINLQFIVAIGSLVTVVGLVFAPVLGWTADRVQRVVMVRIAAVLSALGGILQGIAPGVTHFTGGRVVSGASIAVAQPASFPLMTDYYPAHSRARAFTIYFAATQIGAMLGPPVAGVIADRTSWRVAIISLGMVAAAAALLAFFVKEPRRGQADDAAVPEAAEHVSFAEAYRAARSIVTLRRIWYATPFLAISGLFNLVILPSYLAEVFQMSSTQLGIVTAALHGSAFLGLLVAGPLSERLLADRPGRVMTLGGALTAGQSVLLVGLSLAGNIPTAVAMVLPLAFLNTILLPAFYSVIALVVPPRIRGLGLQTVAPWQVLGLVGVPFVLDWATQLGVRQGILVFVPLLVIGGVIFASAGSGVERDIRAAAAAARADESHRAGGALLVIRGLEVAYDGVVVVEDVDLDVREGEVVALLGTNGAGKSTLLRAMAGTQEASGGAIVFDGRDITHAPPHEIAARGIAVMPGGAATFPTLTVADNLRAASVASGQPYEQSLALFERLLEGLDTPAGALSGGEQQMLGLAQAFLAKPRLLLIDELSLGLSPAMVSELLVVIRGMAAAGTTVVLVEQSVDVAVQVADRAVFMEHGRVRFDGPASELASHPELVRAVFLGRAPSRASSRTHEADVALDVARLSVTFGGVRAVDDVSFSVHAGEVLGIIGANGAGKTTLFDAISGFVSAESGTVRVGDVDVTALKPDARARLGLGRSFQSARLFPSLTVRETIATALERRAVRNPAATALGLPSVRRSERLLARRVDNLVDLLNLEPYADSFVGELSMGTRRAVDLACVLAAEPKVLLLDEPSSGLAHAEVDELGPTLRGVARQTGCAMVLIEHAMPLVTSVSSRVIELELGRVLVGAERGG